MTKAGTLVTDPPEASRIAGGHLSESSPCWPGGIVQQVVLRGPRRLKANLIGLALNEVRSDMSERYYYYGYYGKYYSRYYKPLSN